ncbi:MAG: cobalt ABC transporter permease [Syntrophorhabdales bacterium]
MRLRPATSKILHAGIILCALLALVIAPYPRAAAMKADEPKWQGVDEAVVEKIAREHGREAHGPLIPTDRGDIIPFVFLLAGASGGFAAGYCWRKLMEGRRD